MSTWLPIASAPRDGTRIIAYWPAPSFMLPARIGISVHAAPPGTCKHWTDDGRWCPGPEPTLWQHLPHAPTTPSTEGQGE